MLLQTQLLLRNWWCKANAFSTLAVAGQSNVVADAETDTLTLVAGTGMTLTTDASADSITFASSGGGGGVCHLQTLMEQQTI